MAAAVAALRGGGGYLGDFILLWHHRPASREVFSSVCCAPVRCRRRRPARLTTGLIKSPPRESVSSASSAERGDSELLALLATCHDDERRQILEMAGVEKVG